MNFSIILVCVIMIIALIATIALGGKSDENYTRATKGNLTRLTWIYVILGVGLTVGVGVYIIIV